MLRKTAVCFMTLACAAAFTFVPAQLPWETGYSSSEASSSDESSSGESSYESGSSSNESSSLSESSYSSESSPNETAEETAPAKPAKEKKEKAVKERTAPAGFSTQKSCPVCNSTKIKKNLFVESDKGKIHVCSAACIGRVKRNPAKFAEILEKRGESPEK